jgi:hypothetical protein
MKITYLALLFYCGFSSCEISSRKRNHDYDQGLLSYLQNNIIRDSINTYNIFDTKKLIDTVSKNCNEFTIFVNGLNLEKKQNIDSLSFFELYNDSLRILKPTNANNFSVSEINDSLTFDISTYENSKNSLLPFKYYTILKVQKIKQYLANSIVIIKRVY